MQFLNCSLSVSFDMDVLQLIFKYLIKKISFQKIRQLAIEMIKSLKDVITEFLKGIFKLKTRRFTNK